MYITAFTGLYIIAGCLGKPQCAADRLSEALIGLALVERYSFENKSTVKKHAAIEVAPVPSPYASSHHSKNNP